MIAWRRKLCEPLVWVNDQVMNQVLTPANNLSLHQPISQDGEQECECVDDGDGEAQF